MARAQKKPGRPILEKRRLKQEKRAQQAKARRKHERLQDAAASAG